VLQASNSALVEAILELKENLPAEQLARQIISRSEQVRATITAAAGHQFECPHASRIHPGLVVVGYVKCTSPWKASHATVTRGSIVTSLKGTVFSCDVAATKCAVGLGKSDQL